jgi:hypothetical protein
MSWLSDKELLKGYDENEKDEEIIPENNSINNNPETQVENNEIPISERFVTTGFDVINNVRIVLPNVPEDIIEEFRTRFDTANNAAERNALAEELQQLIMENM